MIRLDDFQGTPEELARFIVPVWRNAYAGKMAIPLWTPEFFRWQLHWHDPGFRRNLIAIYDDSRLMGTLLGAEYPIQLAGVVHEGSLWSWMTIAPEYRGLGFARLLDEERIRRLRSRNIELIVSYRYFGSRYSLAERPKRIAGLKDQKFNRSVGFWARVLDPVGMRRWSLSAMDGFLARLSSPLARVPEPGRMARLIRPAQPEDLPQCLQLIQQRNATSPVAMSWSEPRLRNQLLGSPLAITYVLEDEGRILGFINGHLQPYLGRCEARIGILDLIATTQLSGRQGVALMNAVLAEMVNRGAILALKIRMGDVRASMMLRSRFVARPAETHLVIQPVSKDLHIPHEGQAQLLWR